MCGSTLRLPSTAGGGVAIGVGIVMDEMVYEESEAVELFVGICTLGKLSWQECGGWINRRKRTNQETIKVIQV